MYRSRKIKTWRSYLDQIYGFIELPLYVFDVIATLEFQRLRNVKQLGASNFIFSGATHTRYEHCIGVSYLCQVLLERLEQNSDIQINEFHKKCVILAGLLHDVGHGPFSHMWDQFVHDGRYSEWKHENTSGDVSRAIFENYNIRLAEDEKQHIDGVDMIVALIGGDLVTLRRLLSKDQMYLSEIVSNEYCAIDVDKWDYIKRDSYYLNHAISIKSTFELCFKGARITLDDDQVSHISYHHQDARHVYDLFENRTNLHQYCYQHPDVIGIEQLLLAAFKSAEKSGFLFKGVKLSEAHQHMNVFMYLDDTIIQHIELSEDPRLKEAQSYIRMLKLRQLYHVETMAQDPVELTPSSGRFQWKRRIQTPDEAMPGTVLYHNDNGDIVQRDKNGIQHYVVFCKTPAMMNGYTTNGY